MCRLVENVRGLWCGGMMSFKNVVNRYNVDKNSFDAFCKFCSMALYHFGEFLTV